MDLLQAFVAVAKALINGKADGSAIVGSLPLTEENLARLKQVAQAEAADPFVSILGRSLAIDSINSANQEAAMVQLIPQNLVPHGCHYFQTTGELIERFPVKAPSNPFYVAALDYFSSQAAPDAIRACQSIREFIDLLRAVADYWEDRQPSGVLVFLHKVKYEVLVEYGPEDLYALSEVQAFAREITSAADTENKKTILKAVVCEILSLSLEHPFAVLVRNYEEIKKRYRRSYEMYLANFSWEKLKGELDREKIEFVKKLNATVTDIQTKVIALPAAFLLMATQIKHVGTFDVANLLICIAGVVFGILICLLIRNQLHALDSINGDIARLRQKVTEQSNHGDPEVRSRFEELDHLATRQRWILSFTYYTSFCVSVISIGLFLWYTLTPQATAPSPAGP